MRPTTFGISLPTEGSPGREANKPAPARAITKIEAAITLNKVRRFIGFFTIFDVTVSPECILNKS